jgi:hypothetical protein
VPVRILVLNAYILDIPIFNYIKNSSEVVVTDIPLIFYKIPSTTEPFITSWEDFLLLVDESKWLVS